MPVPHKKSRQQHPRKIKTKSRNRKRRKLIMSLFTEIVIFVRFYIDCLIDFLFSYYYTSLREYVPKSTNDLVLKSATSLASKIRNKEVTSEDVVRAFIERIKEVDRALNAVVDNRFDDALVEAKEIDKKIASGLITENDFLQRPFLGVPFTTKESTLCKGMKCSFGLLCRKDLTANDDAAVVDSLKKAGGILLGVTNIPQLNMWQETSNPVYGITNNPYDTTRNVGGSSGGEAAIVAACGSPLGIVTDIGGSIRIPAFMCGLFGHKPSNNLISTKGLTYRTGNEGPTMVTAGTLTKYAEDITPFLKVLLGNNVGKLKLDENVDVKNLQVYYVTELKHVLVSKMRAEMKTIVARTVNHFKETSKKNPLELDMPNIVYAGKLWRYWLSQEPNINFLRDLTDKTGEVNPYLAILKFLFCRGEYSGGAVACMFNNLLPRENEKWAKKLTEELKTELIEKLGDNGVLLFPSAPWSARYHHTALLRPWNFWYFAIWNALKMPVTQVPLGLDSEGLPLGIQVIAAPNQDHLCIAVAKELEKAFGGYVAPFTTEKSE